MKTHHVLEIKKGYHQQSSWYDFHWKSESAWDSTWYGLSNWVSVFHFAECIAHMKNLCVRYVTHMLALEQKQLRQPTVWKCLGNNLQPMFSAFCITVTTITTIHREWHNNPTSELHEPASKQIKHHPLEKLLCQFFERNSPHWLKTENPLLAISMGHFWRRDINLVQTKKWCRP